jgi:hypothetical protein
LKKNWNCTQLGGDCALEVLFLAPALHFQPHVNEDTAAQIKANKMARKAARELTA